MNFLSANKIATFYVFYDMFYLAFQVDSNLIFQLFTDTFEDVWEIFVDVYSSHGKGKTLLFSTDFQINDFILSIGGK